MTWNGTKIKTDYVRPPIPTKQFDWVAWLDGHEELGSEYGPSRDIAVANLLQWLWERC
jgi:hypothetical protein